eukprot:scaffold33512_cov113-Skeletonema_dohrnii-CCMP3373.AAC.3
MLSLSWEKCAEALETCVFCWDWVEACPSVSDMLASLHPTHALTLIPRADVLFAIKSKFHTPSTSTL